MMTANRNGKIARYTITLATIRMMPGFAAMLAQTIKFVSPWISVLYKAIMIVGAT